MQAVGQPVGGGYGEIAIHGPGHGLQGDLPPEEPGPGESEGKKSGEDDGDALQGEDPPE